MPITTGSGVPAGSFPQVLSGAAPALSAAPSTAPLSEMTRAAAVAAALPLLLGAAKFSFAACVPWPPQSPADSAEPVVRRLVPHLWPPWLPQGVLVGYDSLLQGLCLGQRSGALLLIAS